MQIYKSIKSVVRLGVHDRADARVHADRIAGGAGHAGNSGGGAVAGTCQHPAGCQGVPMPEQPAAVGGGLDSLLRKTLMKGSRSMEEPAILRWP